MKKTFYSSVTLALILSTAVTGYSQELDTYIAGVAGYAMLEDAEVTDSSLPGIVADFEYDPGYFFGVAIGKHFQYVRTEVEVGMQKNTLDAVSVNGGSSVSQDDDDEIRLTTLLLNVYYDFKNKSALTPYITAGLGLGNMKPDGADDSDAVSEYQVGAGVAIKFSEKVTMDLKYRYLETSDGEFDTAKIDYATHNAILGIRYYF